MARLLKDKLRTTEAKSAIKETTAKKSGRKTTTKKPTSKEATIRTARIRKEYVERRNVCKVTFRLPKIVAPNSKSVCIVGDFNNWNIRANPMKREKNGDYDIMGERPDRR
jgi:1,4-alpha-glucan branching enzyme